MVEPRFPRLHPAQVCFVVVDVAAAVDECVARFGWGPFHAFTAPVAEATYGDWSGRKRTDVALGMAGGVQVELIHVHEGHDTVEAYQARYGRGLQHLGISCRDREAAVAALEAIGGRLDDQNEYPGVRFAFVDTPTGPGMFELLQQTDDAPTPDADTARSEEGGAREDESPPLRAPLDRATIVTADLDRALAFHAAAFRWTDVAPERAPLRIDGVETQVRRVRGPAGQLTLELVEPTPGSDDPYARHLARGDHGLVHAGGFATDDGMPADPIGSGEWLDEGEIFHLYEWSGGAGSLQLRSDPR